jgi:ubiquinone biosynthesis protein
MAIYTSFRQRFRSFIRYNQILRVFVKYGFEQIVSYMVASKRYSFIRRIIPKTTRKNAQKYSKWEKMRLVCEELGPTFVKFGQILSNRPDLLPEELILQLEKLQDNVPPMPSQIAQEVIEEELKNSVDQLFAYFETDAFASASMAQVHRATLHTGEKVAIKVQRPGIKQTILEDIRVMYSLADIFEKRIPSLKSFDPHGLVRSFEESILKELDFIHESVNIQRFTNNIVADLSDKTTHSPKVYRTFTTPRVLVLEFISGIKISDVGQMEAKGYDRKVIARRLALTYIKQVFDYGFFHADPHPGNILVTPGQHICFLDFGMMGVILDRDIEMFGNLFLAVKAKDVKRVIRVLQNMSENSAIKDMRALEYAINDFVQSYGVNSIHENEMSSVLMQLKDVIVEHGLKVPPHFFLLARSMVTIEGVIHHLDPSLDLLNLARPYLVKSISRKLDPIKMIKKVLSGIYDFGAYMEDFPQDFKNAIKKINSGKIKVDLTHHGVDPMVHTINRVTRQLVMSLLICSLIIGSTLLMINNVKPLWRQTSVYGLIGVIAAVYLVLRMRRDVRKGDHDDWSGWDE